jgi:hypothetical protein
MCVEILLRRGPSEKWSQEAKDLMEGWYNVGIGSKNKNLRKTPDGRVDAMLQAGHCPCDPSEDPAAHRRKVKERINTWFGSHHSKVRVRARI